MLNLDDGMSEQDVGQYDEALASLARRNPAYAASGRDRPCRSCGHSTKASKGVCRNPSCALRSGLRKNPASAFVYRMQNKNGVLMLVRSAQKQVDPAQYLQYHYPQLPASVIKALMDGRYAEDGDDLLVYA